MAKSSDIIKIGFDYRASLEQFVKETNGVFDGISEKAGKQRISIQLDAKNDKVIEKIKELQKLKLDKFTFEFGESGLAEQLKTFEQLEKKITEIINLSKGINSIGSGNGIGNSIVDEKSLNSIIDLFGKMENHLGEIKRVFADVGDGGEFSPLLSTIDKINTSIKELSTSVKGIGLNMNIDVGSDSEMEAKVQSKIANALQAYQRLFDAIKMSGAGGSVINTNFFEFDINQYDTMMSKIQAYKKFIDNMRNEAKTQYNGKDILYQSVDKTYWTQASAAMGQVTKAFNEMNASSDTNPLKDLFGSGDLSEVISQLGLIVAKLEEISTTASSFKNVFKEGFNVNASVEEIDKLTNRVKELEDELAKIKLNPVSVDKSNISSENQNKQLLEGEEIRKNLYKINDEIGLSEEEFVQKLRQENEEVKNGNRQFQERLALLKDGKVVASYFGDKASMNIYNSDLVDSFDKVIHSHSPIEGSSVPSFEDLDLIFGKYKSDIKEFVLFYNNEMRSLQAPGDMSLLGSEFRDYGKFLDAMSSLTSNSGIYSNYASNYLSSIAEEAGVAYKQIDALGNEINSQRINTSDWEIVLETMKQLTNMHRSQNQDAEFSQIAERGKGLSNTFIDSKNAAEQFEISVESLYGILTKLWESVENDGGKTAFKQLREQLTSLSSDNIKNILYGDEMFYDADGDANELKQVAQKIYDNYYLPLINGAKELKAETDSPMKDVFQGDGKVNTDASTTAIKEESQALEQVSTSAKDAASSKEKFANANKEVKASADSSKTSISEEEKYFNSLGNNLTKYQNALTSISRKPADGNRSKELQEKINIISSSIEKLNALKSKTEENGYIFNKNDVDTGKQLEETIKKNIELVKQMSAAQKGSDALSRGKEIDTITKYLNKFTGISKQARRELNGLLDQLQSGDPSVNVKKIHERFLELTVAERNAGREARNLFDIFKDKKIYSFLGQAASMFSFYDIINVARQAGQAVIDLNTNITELAKVSEASASQIYDDFNSYADIAKEVGGTISDTISATADWSRNGYNIPDAKELAEVAMIYKNVGDGIDIDQANEYLISTLRGFSLEAKDAMDIIDSINEVANNEPISSAGIGEALQRSAAAFNVANTSLQESIALVTSTNSVLQSPEKVGSMWTTVSARIRGAKTELEDAGLETDGMVESTSKLQAMIKGMTGFDILEDDQKTFKSIYDIIIGIGEEFQNLSGVDQAALLEALAGGIILPENMETYLMNIFNCKVNLKLYATI